MWEGEITVFGFNVGLIKCVCGCMEKGEEGGTVVRCSGGGLSLCVL